MAAPRVCLAAALVAWAAGAWSLDLEQAWRAGLANDPQLRAARAAAEGTRERVPQARAQLLPQLGASLQRNRNDLRLAQAAPGGTGVTQHDRYASASDSLTLRQPLYRPQLTAQLRQAEAVAAQGDAALQAEEQNLVMRVTQAYLEVLLAEEQLRLVAVQRAAYAAQLDAARKGFAAGSGIRTDIDEAQARIDLNVAQELEARQAIEFARRQLATVIGEAPGALAPLAMDRLPLALPRPPTLDAWLARAEEASPELRAASAQLQAAREQVDVARAGHHPTLDAIAQLSRNENDTPTRVNSKYDQKLLGVQLNVPLYQGGLVDSQVRQALAEVARLEALLQGARLDLWGRVHREFRGVGEGIARVRALEQAVRSSEQLVTSSRRSQAGGARTLLDVLNAEQQLGQARRDLAQARLAYVLALVRLRALAGEAGEVIIDEANGWLATR